MRLLFLSLYEDGALLRLLPFMIPLGFLALLAGWFTTEIGRQPWLVYGLFRTADGASRLEAHQVVTSLIGFGVVYTVIFGAGLYYVRSEEHTYELQSLMRISYDVFCLKKKKDNNY